MTELSEDAPETDEAPDAEDRPLTRAGKIRLLTLDHLDNRTNAARKARSLAASIIADQGGKTEMSALQQQLAKHAAVLGAMIEDLEARWLRGTPLDPLTYATLLNAQRRLAVDLGLPRKARAVPSVDAYLSTLAKQPKEAAA